MPRILPVTLLIWALLLGVSTMAQEEAPVLQQPLRLEVPLDRNQNGYYTWPMERHGLMLYRGDNSLNPKYDEWTFMGADTLLQVKWQNTVVMDNAYSLAGIDSYEQDFFLLFSNSFDINQPYKLLRVNITTGQNSLYNLKKSLNIKLNEFEMLSESALLGGYVNNLPTLLLYNFEKGQVKVLPGYYSRRIKPQNIEMNDERGYLGVLMRVRDYRQQFVLDHRFYDQQAAQIRDERINMPKGPIPLATRTFGQYDSTLYYMGTWGEKENGLSKGLFFSRLRPGKDPEFNYMHYGVLENFLHYLKPKKEKRLRRRIKRNEDAPLELPLEYRMKLNQVVEHNGLLYLSGVAYFPKYNYSGNPNVLNNSQLNNGAINTLAYTSSVNRTRIVGYTYTHAMVACFDKSGALMWDQILDLDNITTVDLQQLVHLGFEHDTVSMLYLFEGEIQGQKINQGTITHTVEPTTVELPSPNDKLVFDDESRGELRHWYGNNYVVTGTQRVRRLNPENIKNNEAQAPAGPTIVPPLLISTAEEGIEPGGRKVFYINKVRL